MKAFALPMAFEFRRLLTCSGKRTSHGCPKCGKERQLQNYSETMQEKRPEYPQWFIDDLALEEDRERARNREITKRDKILFHCDKHGDYLPKCSRKTTPFMMVWMNAL